MKYAVVESGGKQYIAREGQTIEIDRMPLEVGAPVEFESVMLVADGDEVSVGAPFVQGAAVKGIIVEQLKAPKIIVFKYIPKERYRRKQGHRQRYTRVEVESISVRKPKAKPEKVDEPQGAPKATKPTTKPDAEKASASKPATKKKPATRKPKAEAKGKPESKANTGTKKSGTKKTTSDKK